MDSLYTLTDLAESFTQSIGGDAEQQKRIHRQLRNVLTQRLLTPTDTRGGRRDALFNNREAAKARIQIAIIDAGLDAVTLQAVSDYWDRAVDPRLGLPPINGNFPPYALDAVLSDAVRADVPEWAFVIKVRRDIETGERKVIAAFVRADQPEPPEHEPISGKGPHADNVEVHEGRFGDNGDVVWARIAPRLTIATITIPATALIRPLLSE
ncbi:hypothetical protein GUK36_15500 [Rhizobium leguminosarum]|uniref:Uncharacterized protein n=1 Tax=Rhizobium leguminosarum TaxID=384 RepID=A0A6P0DCV6_RHILE|nr:hypothetical protein [Rhizobium leguminosarum]NEK50834.1 hypothetical protein [Rhizobium leguminosarum]